MIRPLKRCVRSAGFLTLVVLGGGTVAAAQDNGRAGNLRLLEALEQQDRRAAHELLDEGVDVNVRRADGVTALHLAAHWDDLVTVERLLAAGADPTVAEDHGITALALASENASVAMVETLLFAGAPAEVAQTNGVTPLMTAARTGQVAVVEALLARGASVNATTTTIGQTALMWAVSEGHADMVRVLLAAGADVAVSSTRGFTPLLFAARNGDVTVAELLLDAGAGVNQLGSDDTHALPLAIVSGQDTLATMLLKRGADPNGSIYGVTALHAAAGPVDMWLRDWLRVRGIDGVFGSSVVRLSPERQLAMVQILLDHGADPNARITTSTVVVGYLTAKRGAFEPYSIGTGDLRGATPLWVAAFAANGSPYMPAQPMPGTGPEIVRVLMEGGADPSLTTNDGTTPLMVAAGLGRMTFSPGLQRGRRSASAEATVKLLVDSGVDINSVNEADFRALHGAAFRGLNEVLQYLVEQGADIDARDFRGRTAYRIAEGAKQSFQFQAYPGTAAFLAALGADVTLGMPGEVLERQLERDLEVGSERP